MVLRLVQNMATGVYEYKEAQVAQKPAINTNAFEAYEGGEQTSLATGAGQTTDLGQQTESILQREAPGQLSFDAATGTIKEKDPKDAQIGVGKITDMTATSAQTGITETPLEKAARIAQMTPMGTGGAQFDDSLIRRQLELQEKANKMNSILKAGDLGLQAYRAYKGIGNVGSVISGTTGPITPLTGGSFGGSTFMSGAGGAAVAGGLGYGVSKMLGGSAKENRAAGVGSAVGMAVGGPVGGVVGGVIGRVFGCFLPDTKVTMLDGTTKNIIDINLNDNISIGGRVFAHAKFLITDLYDYKGVKVSGSHMVNEDNKWLRVEESNLAKSLGNKEHTVYTLGTDNRRILINNILFTDYFEVDEKEELQTQGDKYFNNWKNHSIELQKQNKNILNAI
jgi:hypothetical protein